MTVGFRSRIILAALLNNPAGRLLNYIGVSRAGVSRASPIIGTSPLFAAALAVSIGGESLDALVILGTVLIIAGLALILSQE